MHHGILLEFTILLVLSAATGVLATLLRQPVMMAFIAVGVVAGPGGMDILSNAEAWNLLSVAGISILLFVVGLRLDPEEVRTTGPVALLAGVGQILVTALLGMGLALVLGFEAGEAIYLAVALTFSSTIIVVKLLSDKRELDSLHGRIAVGILIVQDLAVVLVMIAISAFGAEGNGSAWRAGVEVVLKGAAMVVVLAAAARWLVKPLFAHLARVPELLVLGAIAWAMALAVGSEELGFSTEVGAFLGGVTLAPTRFRDAIGNRLVSLRDFMLLFFFVTLGASLDPAQVADQLVPALAFSAFVLIVKPIVVAAVVALLHYRVRTSFLTGLSMAQISEFSLILGALGLAVGHIDDDTLSLITLVTMITIASSTYFILYSHVIYDRLAAHLDVFERATPRIEGDGHTGAAHRPEVVVIGLGRFGGELLQRLIDGGTRAVGIDFDPQAIRFWEARGVTVHYGDVEDPELHTSIPRGAQWVVSTLPTLQANRHLMEVLRGHGYEGKFALTAHRKGVADALEAAGADLVMVPFAEAAANAAEVISGRVSVPLSHELLWLDPNEVDDSESDEVEDYLPR